jgi:lambda repressor-like predicted transcriptional regulator
MHCADIKAAIEKSGNSYASIAANIIGHRTGRPVTLGAVSQVVRGRRKSLRIAQEIAEATGLEVKVLFPGRYKEPDGGSPVQVS